METRQPKLRFPEFKENLVRCKLSKKMNVFRGASPRPKGDPRYYGGLVPRLMIKDATRDGKYVYPKIDFLTELGAEKSRLLKKDSVVLSCSGTIVAIPTILGVDACIHDGWLGFNNFKDVNTEFLYYNFVKLHEIMQGSATTGGVFNNLTTSIIKDYEISFPIIEEQTRIANFLSSVDEKLNLLKEKKALLEEYKKGIMQKIFNQELRFKDDKGEDFEDWEEKRLGEIADFYKGKGLPKSELVENGNFKCIHYGELFTKYQESINKIHSTTNYNDKAFFSICNDVLMPTSDVTPNGLATASCLNEDNVVLGGDVLVIRQKIKILNGVFLAFFIKENRDSVMKLVSGSTVYHLYGSDMKNLIIKYPCLEEQTKIANFLSAIDEKIELVSNQIEDTQEYKKGLLQQMFV